MSQRDREFRGTGRYEILDRLGSGGMGAVYSARDHERDQVVALKTLYWVEPSAIYRLKKEFRALSDVVHPNLVALYELVAEEGQWFYTMEMVDGIDFARAMRPEELDLPSLRQSLPQFAAGIHTVHEAGKLHRDLKPSNVLVTSEGRVVILDFGIVADLTQAEGEPHTMAGEGIWGTAAYMAPEQANGEATAASDWYAMGVMIYEVLTGKLPFSGPPFSIIAQKLQGNVPHPDEIVPGLPADLVELCLGLMALEPADRPSGAEILERLGAVEERPTSVPPIPAARLVGREQQLGQLEDAFHRAQAGKPVLVCVHGPSGIGKSTLLEKFVDQQARDSSALVLRGRCYERESVPYKGVDAVIDSLSRFLRALPKEQVKGLIPEDLKLLCTIFPALERVAVIAELPSRREIRDPVETRRRAFMALRELLRRVAALRPLIIYIDDLQWADEDSIGLLNELLLPVDTLGLLLLVSFPSEEIEATPFLRELINEARTELRREVRVGPLTITETRRLALDLAGSDGGLHETFLEPIIRESAGSPFLVEQLVRYALGLVTEGGADGTMVTLHDVLDSRLAALPPEARRLLNTVAVAGRPIDSAVAWDAAELEGDERQTVKLLCGEHLLRFTGSAHQVEFCHGRLREAVRRRIPTAQFPIIHGQLAGAMEARGIHDPEGFLEHWLAAGDPEKAAQYATEAADRAGDALAFERAAVLYRRAIELSSAADETDTLRVKRAAALANAGRGAEAAAVYLETAVRVSDSSALELRRLAAEQLLRSGHIDHGLGVIRSVLAAVGLRLARSPRHALLRVILRTLLIRLRGLNFTAHDRGAKDRSLKDRVDTCWAVTIGLGRVDTIRATDFETLHFLLALKLGDPYRFVRALAARAAFVSIRGTSTRKRADKLVRLAGEWAQKIQEPYATAIVRFVDGIAGFYVGEFARTLEHEVAAERTFREECVGVAWEINTAQQYTLSSLYYLGEYQELRHRAPLRLKEALDHGDLYAASDVAAGRPIVAWLCSDEPEEAREHFREAMGKWTLHGFHFQHYSSLLAQVQVDLYTGEAEAAWSYVRRRWPDLSRSMLLRIQQIRVEVCDLRARAALASATLGLDDRAQRIKSARQDARRILREKVHWGNPLAHLILSAASAAEGDEDSALSLAREATDGFTAAGMQGHAAVARRRYGELAGGEEGRKAIEAAEAWMTSQGVVNPARIAAMLSPGFAPSG